MRTPAWITPLLALALTITPLAGLAAAQGQEKAPADAFTDLVDALGAANPEEAESAYRQAFAPHAEEAPTAASAAEDAFQDAREAEAGSPAYKAATQTAKKGVLAVSFHTVRTAAEEGDVDTARAYFDVLATKFDGEDTLPDSKQAFADVDEASLPAAVETLEDEYRSLISAKVYAETTETPDLVEAQPATAAKEAGEALGYALSIHAHVEQVQGAGAADHLHDELEGLVEHTLAQEPDATEAEAGEVLEALAAYRAATAPDEKLAANEAFHEAIEENNLDEAQSVYEEAFAEHASEYAPEAHQRVQDALAQARQAEGADLTVQHEILEKSILDVAWAVGFHELAEEELEEATAYLAILADKFDSLEDPEDVALDFGHLAASQDASSPHAEDLRAGLAEAFTDKVHEEIDEVFINWDDRETAREKAIEAVVYYQPIREEVATTLSEEDAEHLDAELRGLYNATTEGDREEAEHEAGEAREVLDAFANAGQDVSELDQALQEIERTLGIITVEIEEYFEYKEKGDMQTAQEEIEESKAFIAKALSVFEDNREALEAADEQAAGDLEDDMQRIQTLLEDEENLDEIPDIVDQATQRLDAFETSQATGPAVDVRFGTPQPAADEGYRVPVHLVDVPEDGYSVQATVTYDASQLTVESVEIPADVGAQTISPGEVRFNAASTGASDTEPVVAELHVVADGAEDPELAIEMEELTDGQGQPLRVGNVTGQQLQLASLSGQDVPAAGLLGILAGFAAALAVHRRR